MYGCYAHPDERISTSDVHVHSTLKVPPSVLASKIPKRRIIKNLLVVLELRIVLVGKSECRQTGPTLITKALELCMQTATYCG